MRVNCSDILLNNFCIAVELLIITAEIFVPFCGMSQIDVFKLSGIN
jgi:hypothetical protein